jgi:NAD(P)-dependent dehydrogenase (short-subunit alcohol dehydrogenase family)
MSTPFKARTALVTGAGRGIGRHIALGLAETGAAVVLLARSADQLAETARLVQDAGGRALAVPGDVVDPVDRAAAVRAATDAFGPIDILVNNAAVVWPLGPSVRLDLGEWAAALGVNVTAVAGLTFEVLPSMLERGWGRIVNISSAIVASPGNMVGGNAYATSKAALEAHSLNLAAELAGTGVTVNVYRPGGVDTAMQEWIRSRDAADIPDIHRRFHHNYDEGLLITPATSAKALLAHLDSDGTGQVWDVSDKL